MFAVSGWNLEAGPTTQVDESVKKKKRRSKSSKSASSSNATPIANKRFPAKKPEPEKETPKSKGEKQTVVTSENVLVLYEKIIEGKKPAKKPRDRKKSRKPAKADPSEVAALTVAKKRSRPHDEEGGEGLTSKTIEGAKEGNSTQNDSQTVLLRKKKEPRGVIRNANTVSSTANTEAQSDSADKTPGSAPISTLTPLQQKMRQKLSSARFRHINEILYTTSSNSSLSLFREQPEMYQEYHTGFRRQVEVWPENPVDVFIKQLQERGRVKFERGHNKKWNSSAGKNLSPLPRDKEEGWCTVADLGCGDARIAATINHQKPRGKAKVKVLSYDLQASTPDVTVADISHLPLKSDSVDVAIFCLALMGTNFLDFVEEAYRILRWRGELWVAEIKSRFNCPGANEVEDDAEMEGGLKKGAEPYKPFVDALSKRGFALRGTVDDGNKMFVRMEFVKMQEKAEKDGGGGESWEPRVKKKKLRFVEKDEVRVDQILKPCVYKSR
ncbi:methyltransferase-domain-containing protein [Tuber indicum]|nr:methyltransferase-domain-containing protein [Tuber indicum]